MKSVSKVTGLVSQTIYFNTKQQTTWFPLQSNPPRVSSVHFSILLCRVSVHCWKDSFGMPTVKLLRRYGPLDGLSPRQVRFSLKTLDDVLTHLHAALLLIIIIQQPLLHSVQTFRVRGGVNKSMWNKIQWLQKAKITVIYSQDILLDDNTIRLFFRP